MSRELHSRLDDVVIDLPPEHLLDAPAQGNSALLLWGAALRQYWLDSQHPGPSGRDDGEAHADLHGDRRILARLCDKLGLDVDYVARRMLATRQRRPAAPKRTPDLHRQNLSTQTKPKKLAY